jgi:peptide/nickel transport system substrate-binding protein
MVKLAVACLALLLSACQQTDPEAIVFAVATAPSVLDPRLASDAASERVNALLYGRLLDLDANGEPVPAMAEWRQVDERRYHVALRADRLPFWDGRLPVAEDVAATYRSIADPALGSPHASTLGHIERIRVIDDERLEFLLTRSDPLFPSRLTVGIVPAALASAQTLARTPLGSGPFAFDAWRSDGALRLRRRSDGQVVVFEPVPDPTMRALKLMRGEAQLLQNDLPSELYDYLARQPGIAVSTYPGITFAYLGFNLADPLLARREIRAAIAHAIDREAIIEHLFAGRARHAESVLREEHWAGVAGLSPYRHDPALARSLLKAAGFDGRKPLEIGYKTSTDPFRLRIAHVLQSQLAEVGIRLRISSYDWGTFFGDIKAGHFQMYSLAWVGVNTADILRYAFHSDSLPPQGANRGRYRSTQVDAMIERAERGAAKQAAALFAEVQRQVHQDLVYVPLWYEFNVSASRGLRDYRPGFDGNYLALQEVRRDPGSE